MNSRDFVVVVIVFLLVEVHVETSLQWLHRTIRYLLTNGLPIDATPLLDSRQKYPGIIFNSIQIIE